MIFIIIWNEGVLEAYHKTTLGCKSVTLSNIVYIHAQ